MRPMQKSLSPLFYSILSLPATAMGFALSVQISALSWILSTQYGLKIEEVGLVWAAGPLAGILGQVIIGIVSDNVWFFNGRRRPFILIGGIFAALSLLALPNIDIISTKIGVGELLGIAILVALTLDLSINISFNPTRSIIADVTPEGSARTKGYTWMQTISGSFGVLAYAIGAIWGNFVLIYVGAGLVLLLSIVPPLFITEPKQLACQSEPIKNRFSLLELLMQIKPLWGFLAYDIYAIAVHLLKIEVQHHYVEIALAIFSLVFVLLTLSQKTSSKQHSFQKVLAAHSFSWVGVQTMFVFMFAFLQFKFPALSNDALGKIIATSFLVLSAVSAILPATVLAPMTEKMGRVKTHIICLATMSVGYTLLAVVGHTTWVIYVLMAVLGIGWSAIISLPFAIMSEQVESTQMGKYMGLFNLSIVLPQLLVSTGIGLAISQIHDKDVVFYIAAVSLVISTLAWTRVEDAQNVKTTSGKLVSEQ